MADRLLPDGFREYISKDGIKRAVEELGNRITDDYRGRPLVVVIVANGGIFFGVDLVRALHLPVHVETITVSSYVNDIRTDKMTLDWHGKTDMAGKDVLIVDDVLDSGNTMRRVKTFFLQTEASSVKTAVFLRKTHNQNFNCEYSCFDFPDEYAIGYGMDSHGLYRNLECIGVRQ